ncbi:MAG: hypothetical protein KDD60_04665, partial [Bdellovibrionales bacterium]|nr:hypothetical protein [Bdellovibrionales bacterium]
MRCFRSFAALAAVLISCCTQTAFAEDRDFEFSLRADGKLECRSDTSLPYVSSEPLESALSLPKSITNSLELDKRIQRLGKKSHSQESVSKNSKRKSSRLKRRIRKLKSLSLKLSQRCRELAETVSPTNSVETLSGTLKVIITDRIDSSHHSDTYLQLASGAIIRLEGDLEALDLSGINSERVQITGRFLDTQSTEPSFQVQAVKRIVAGASQRTLQLDGTRKQTIGFFFVQVGNKPPACSSDTILQNMFRNQNSVNALFESSSFGNLSFMEDGDGDGNPDVFSRVYQIDGPTSGDHFLEWERKAKAAIGNEVLKRFDHVVYIFPTPPALGVDWAGRADLACMKSSWQCMAMLLECTPRVLSHELGHNVGFGHAWRDMNNDNVIDPSEEYADLSSPMGSGYDWNIPHFNGYHKFLAGWFTPFSGSVREIRKSGEYRLFANELHPENVDGVQLYKVYDSARHHWEYLSYRRNLGPWKLADEYRNGATFHVPTESFATQYMHTFRDGESHDDSLVSKTTFKQVSHTENSVVFQISIPNNPDTEAPTVSFLNFSLWDQPFEFTAGEMLPIEIQARDNDLVQKVVIKVNGNVVTQIPTAKSDKYEFVLDTSLLPAGESVVEAIAYDMWDNSKSLSARFLRKDTPQRSWHNAENPLDV